MSLVTHFEVLCCLGKAERKRSMVGMQINKPHYLLSADKKTFILYRTDQTPTDKDRFEKMSSVEKTPKVWGSYPNLPELQRASMRLFGELAINAKPA
jgi:hypothetical protein